MSGRTRMTIGLSALALLAAGCGGNGGEPAGPGGSPAPAPGGSGRGNGVLEIGYVLPQTGQLAFLGPRTRARARACR